MDEFYDKFLATLGEFYPHKPDLVNALTEVLHLEKESIYRRLRKNVYFSADELMHVCSAWNISLDNIVCTNPDKTRIFYLKAIDFCNPCEVDYSLLEQFNRDLKLVAQDPDGRMFEVLNCLPRGLYCRTESLTRFFTMKWLYKYASCDEARSFCDIHISERMRALDLEYIQCIHAIPEVHSIHDNRLFENLIGEIIYFRSIGMLTGDEVVLLRGELLTLVDYLEDVAVRGTFPSGNKMFFYLSHTWLETECVLYKSQNFNLSRVKILERNSLTSMDQVVLQRLMNMVESVKQSSVLISGSNALQQAEFFTRQRQMIQTL